MPYRYNAITGELDLVQGPGGGTSVIEITTDSGTVTPDGSGNINVLGGANTSTSGTGNTVTIDEDSTTNITEWVEVTGTSASAEIGKGYVLNNASLVTITLPATAAFGGIIAFVGKGAGLYKIAQNASQTIHYGILDSTTGTGGSLTATQQYDAITLVCSEEDTDFTVRQSTGSFTVV